jgi:hypothetical protein
MYCKFSLESYEFSSNLYSESTEKKKLSRKNTQYVIIIYMQICLLSLLDIYKLLILSCF